jgi:hypothetical protein
LEAEVGGFVIYTASNAVEVVLFDQPDLYTDDRYKAINPAIHDEPNAPGAGQFFAPGPGNFKIPFWHGRDEVRD